MTTKIAMTTTYTTLGDVCGSCDHTHWTIAGAQRCADRHQADVARGNPGGRAYSDRVVVRTDGEPLTDWEREELAAYGDDATYIDD